MSKDRIAVGIDGSEHSIHALEVAIAEAGFRGVGLDVIYVSDFTPAILHFQDTTVNTREVAEETKNEVWEAASATLDSADIDYEKVNLEGVPSKEIVKHCEKTGTALLVLGTRGRGKIESMFLGSTSKNTLEHAPCDVLIAKLPR